MFINNKGSEHMLPKEFSQRIGKSVKSYNGGAEKR